MHESSFGACIKILKQSYRCPLYGVFCVVPSCKILISNQIAQSREYEPRIGHRALVNGKPKGRETPLKIMIAAEAAALPPLLSQHKPLCRSSAEASDEPTTRHTSMGSRQEHQPHSSYNYKISSAPVPVAVGSRLSVCACGFSRV